MDIASLASTVIFLFGLAGENQIPLGTAFIIGYPVPNNPEISVPLVVTAKHVIAGRNKILGRFNSIDGKTTKEVLYDLEALRNSGDLWEHQDKGVDIVVFRTLHFEELSYQVFPIQGIASKNTIKEQFIKATDPIVFPFLLVNLMETKRNYPIIKTGHIALISEEPIPMNYKLGNDTVSTEQELILIDAIAVPGASGSPVYLQTFMRPKGEKISVGGVPWLLGIINGFYPAVPRVLTEINTTANIPAFSENSGIAIVFPAWRITEILTQPKVKARIEILTAK